MQEHINNQYSKHKLSDNNEYQSHQPITNSDVHLCLFDRFHENNTSSEIESLRKVGCVLKLKGMFNSEVEEQLHLQFHSNKKFLNMMTPVTHIYLFSFDSRPSQFQQKQNGYQFTPTKDTI